MAQLLDELTKDTVTKGEVKAVLDAFIARFNGLVQMLNAGSLSMKEETARLSREMADFEKRLREYTDGASKKTIEKLETQFNELRVDLAYVESLIKDYDDTSLRRELSELRSSIPELPEAFDPTPIFRKLKELEDKLNTAPKVVQGGVTDMRIRQAFKYILKTEAPVGAIDGLNLSYTLSQPIFAILAFSLNGEVIAQLPNYTVHANTITFSTALPAVYSGKDFECKYI